MNTIRKASIVAIGLLLCVFVQVQTVNAQSDGTEIKRIHNNIDLSIAVMPDAQIVSGAFIQELGIGKKRAFKFNYGVRFSSYFGDDIIHFSAPPDFYNDEATRDTLWATSAQMNNLALVIGASYVYKNKVEVGFNIDAVGYTFGGDKAATYTGDGVQTVTTVNPGSVTALLIAANDIGMLKSEFFAGYKFNDQWKVRLGWVSLFTEYRTPTELQKGNTRYRAASLLPLAAVTFSL